MTVSHPYQNRANSLLHRVRRALKLLAVRARAVIRTSRPLASLASQVLSGKPGKNGGRPAEVLLAYGRNRWAEGAFFEAAKRVFRVEEVPGSELDEVLLRTRKLSHVTGNA